MIHLTRLIAVEYGRRGIRANAVAPGTVATRAWDARRAANPPVMEEAAAHYPLGRVATPTTSPPPSPSSPAPTPPPSPASACRSTAASPPAPPPSPAPSANPRTTTHDDTASSHFLVARALAPAAATAADRHARTTSPTPPLAGFTLSYTAITRVMMPDAPAPRTPPSCAATPTTTASPRPTASLPPGGSWTFRVSRPQPRALPPRRRRQDRLCHARRRHPCRRRGRRPRCSGRASEPPPALLPEGRLDLPFALCPGPRASTLAPGDDSLRPHPGRRRDRRRRSRALAAAGALHRRLFPAARAAVSLSPVAARPPRRLRHRRRLAPGGYRLTFAPDDPPRDSDADGRRHGLTALLQLLHGASTEPGPSASPRPAPSRTPRATTGAAATSTSRATSGRPRTSPLPRHPRLVPDERLPLAPDRRRGLALRGPGPARRSPPSAPPAAPTPRCCRSSATRPPSRTQFYTTAELRGHRRPRRRPRHRGRPRGRHPRPLHRDARRPAAPRRPRRAAGELPLGPGLPQQRAQPRDRGHLRRPRPRLRRAGRRSSPPAASTSAATRWRRTPGSPPRSPAR